jgi:hypothetical protein
VQSGERSQERRYTSLYAAIVECIYARPDNQRWWFWWSSPEPTEPITKVDATADRIVATLGSAQ